MGNKTRKKDQIKKVIADVPEKLHKEFKEICETEGVTIRATVEGMMRKVVDGEISIDMLCDCVVEKSLHSE